MLWKEGTDCIPDAKVARPERVLGDSDEEEEGLGVDLNPVKKDMMPDCLAILFLLSTMAASTTRRVMSRRAKRY